ncbi:hypothetical protein GE253_24790 [Niveispirillum sp. SYP-B3756]|uniref:class I SAM-dependent methyltransferase n=1 Tax=Niveispirillum sp. SYP-B3756 TaxID=2662178 RepID=UPI0012909489|nr:class I SAM-dependent methyltransferase [Niveispirillum sp. SYP-B3756]MQP68541.1 hypothetical protein [Niveispirillum sp. SYP-B3756]
MDNSLSLLAECGDEVVSGIPCVDHARVTSCAIQTFGSKYPAIKRAYEKFGSELRALPMAERTALAQLGQERWSGTALATRQRRELVAVLNTCDSSQIDEIDTLIDLGAGDGRVIEAICSDTALGSRLNSIILVDRDKASLDEATRRLQRYREAGLSIDTRCLDIRDHCVWKGLKAGRTLVLASASLHELDRADKVTVLSRIARNASYLVLVELAADHDAPPTQDMEFRHKAAAFYDALIADAIASLPASQHCSVAGAFLLGELEAMLTHTYAARQNYHLAAEKWRSAILACGFRLIRERLAEILPGGAPTYFLLAQTSPR